MINRTNLIEEVEWLLGGGEHPTRIASALGMTVPSIARALQRQGRQDLAAPFAAERKR